jgi:hypothetical protein
LSYSYPDTLNEASFLFITPGRLEHIENIKKRTALSRTSGRLAHIENLSDAELYEKLQRRGIAAGLVVGEYLCCTLLKALC